MTPMLLPIDLIHGETFHIWPLGTDASGGLSLGGPGQEVDWSAGGMWAGETGALKLYHPAQWRVWRMLCLHIQGGGEVVVPIADQPQRPFAEGQTVLPGVPHSDGSPFSDGSLYQTNALRYELAEPVKEGDTHAVIRRLSGAPLRGGEWWTLIHPGPGPRAYCIGGLDPEVNDVREVWFGCPMRSDMAAGSPIDFENPRTTVKNITPVKSLWPKAEPPFKAEVNFQFVESLAYLEQT